MRNARSLTNPPRLAAYARASMRIREVVEQRVPTWKRAEPAAPSFMI
jgi:hypothetical protein